MAIPELDLKKVNLQAAVGYLISLHDNEVDWNLLGIKVIGHIDDLPIPAGTYDYGDAYMIGTETPYTMYIYTRADGEVHPDDYWFPIGKFPMPGPKGDKGDGIETIVSGDAGIVQRVDYDVDLGAEVQSKAKLKYTDSTNGSTKTQEFPLTYKMPIVPGKYIAMDANSDNDALTVKVDDTALALDYIKINKDSRNYVPWWNNGVIKELGVSQNADGSFLALRLPNGQLRMTTCMTDTIQTVDGNYTMSTALIYLGVADTTLVITKTSTDTGTMTASQLNRLQQYPNTQINYDNQVYIRQDPQTAPDGTLNYIHIDSVQDGNGGYKATGKCFSITTSTRAWQVVDLNFGGALYQHNIGFTLSGTNDWYIKLILTTSSATPITTTTLSQYLTQSDYPLIGGTPIDCYRSAVQNPFGFGNGRISASNNNYYFALYAYNTSEVIATPDATISGFVDTVTTV